MTSSPMTHHRVVVVLIAHALAWPSPSSAQALKPHARKLSIIALERPAVHARHVKHNRYMIRYLLCSAKIGNYQKLTSEL